MAAIAPVTIKIRADTDEFVGKLREARREVIRMHLVTYTPIIVALMVLCGIVLGVGLGRLI